MNELVSVIIPVYNVGEILKESVNSLLLGEYQKIEILIVDDGSDEQTTRMCDDIAGKDERIKVIHQQNMGVSGARNTGIDCAKGDYILFVDADDKAEKQLISTLLDDCKKNGADIAISGYREWYEVDKYEEVNCSKEFSIKEEKEVLKEFFLSNKIGWNVWAKLYKKDVIGNIRFVEGKKTAEDMFFVYEVLKNAKKIVIHEEPLYNYIKQENSAMADTNCEKFFDTFYLINEVYKDNSIDSELEQEKLSFYLKSGLWFFRFIIAKDKKHEYQELILNARVEFLNNIKGRKIDCGIRSKIEVFMLKYVYFVFKMFACYWGGQKKEQKCKNRNSSKMLREQLKREKSNYPNSWFDNISCNQRVYNWRFIKLLRKCEYYREKANKSINPIWKGLYWISRTRKNRLGVFIGVEIPENVFDEGLIIHHNGNIVVNGSAKVGKNCQLHGDNCIGNVGKENSLTDCPRIGNNVEIGVGAKVIGGITLADNIKIGANAVVTQSFYEDGITLVGIPARKLER